MSRLGPRPGPPDLQPGRGFVDVRGMKHLLFLLALVVLPACGSDADADDFDNTPLTEADLDQWEEARAYLDAEKGVWAEGLSIDDLRSLVDECYDAGSPRVMFAGIEEIGQTEISAWLVVEMPLLKAERPAVIAAFNKVAAPYGQPATRVAQLLTECNLWI